MHIDSITKRRFSIFLKSGVQVVDGNIISDSGKDKGLYHFAKVPVSEKVSVLYGRKIQQNGFSDYLGGLSYLGLVIKDGKIAFYSGYFANMFRDDLSGESDKETYSQMTKLLYDKLCAMNPETEETANNPWYIASASKIAFRRAVCGKNDYKDALSYLTDVIKAPWPKNSDWQPCFELLVQYLECPDNWADFAIELIDKLYIDSGCSPFSATIGRDAVIVERMAQRLSADYNDPTSKEYRYKRMFSGLGYATTVRLKIEVDGDVMKVPYPMSEIACPQTVRTEKIPTESIYPLRIRREAESFLEKHSMAKEEIPMRCVKTIYYGNVTFWEAAEREAAQ